MRTKLKKILGGRMKSNLFFVLLLAIILLGGISATAVEASVNVPWQPIHDSSFWVSFNFTDPFATNPFFIYDWGNTNTNLSIGYPTSTIYFHQDLTGNYYANYGLTDTTPLLSLGSTPTFGIFMHPTTGSPIYDYAVTNQNPSDPGHSWDFLFQSTYPLEGHDIKMVPLPASALLLVSGFIGVIGFRTRFWRR